MRAKLFTSVKNGITSHARARSSQAEIFSVTNLTIVSVNKKNELMLNNVSISSASDHFTSCSFSDPAILVSAPVNNNGWLYR